MRDRDACIYIYVTYIRVWLLDINKIEQILGTLLLILLLEESQQAGNKGYIYIYIYIASVVVVVVIYNRMEQFRGILLLFPLLLRLRAHLISSLLNLPPLLVLHTTVHVSPLLALTTYFQLSRIFFFFSFFFPKLKICLLLVVKWNVWKISFPGDKKSCNKWKCWKRF